MEPPLAKYTYLECTANPIGFFNILPIDWSEEIVPVWNEYAASTHVFCISSEDTVVAGGLVFSKVSPDTQGYFETAQEWLDKGFRYIGFVFVDESHRGKGLGRMWMNKLKSNFPNESFWLAIDNYDLVNFYQPLGFNIASEVDNDGEREWILVSKMK